MARELLDAGAFDDLAQRAGFKAEGAAGLRERVNEASAADMNQGGEYRVLGAYTKGSGAKQVRVKVEQNTSPMVGAPEPFADIPVVHPPVAVVEGPVGSVCVNLDDPDAEEVLTRAEQAVTDPNYQGDAQ